MTETILRVRGLTSFGSNGYNLQNINLNFKSSTIHALVGEKGVGKKTFVQVFAGITKDVQGEVIYKNKNIINELSLFNNKDIQILIQQSKLLDNFTIAENFFVHSYPKIFLTPFINKEKLYKEADEVLKELNISLDINTKVEELNFEERKLIDIVKLFFTKPKIAVLHEPTENLGSSSIKILYKAINILKKQGSCIIYITNQWEEALHIADNISVLTDGQVVGSMTSSQAKKNPRELILMIYGWDTYYKDTEDTDESREVLEAVFKSAEFLTSDYELNDVLNMLANYVVKVMNADSCYIYLIDEETKSIIDIVKNEKNKNIGAVLKKEMILDIIKKNELYYCTDKNKNFKSMFSKLENIKTVIFIPIFIRSHITGIIQISYKDYYVHSEKEIKYLSTLARQVAIAIEDTRLMGRSALLQESHHRIKNNLQNIISLIYLQKSFMKNENKSVENIFDDVIKRIKSIAAVHDLLSNENLGRSIINLKKIINAVVNLYKSNNITINLDLDNILIPYNKATAIALIINESLNNSFKHAFTSMDRGMIYVSCVKCEDYIKLLIKDNGKGLGDDFNKNASIGMGLSIVKSVIQKEFKGNISFDSESGTTLKILLPIERVFISK